MVKEPSILVIEDDLQIRRSLRVGLESSGYVYTEAVSGKEGLLSLATHKPDLVVLDLGLPDTDGQDLLAKIREWSAVPIIVLTARDRDQDKIQALDQGADDYLTKPFSIGELLARIRVALRHAQGQGNTQSPFFENGDLHVDWVKRQVLLKGREVHLTPTEYKILAFLIKHTDKVVTQHQLLQEVWGPGTRDQETI